MALPLWGLANWFRMAAVPGGAWAWALGLHLASWFAQIVLGHQMCEHRKPALMDSFFQVGAGAGRRVRGRGRGALQQPRSDVLLASLPTRPHNDVPPPTHTHTSSFKPLDADPAPPCPALQSLVLAPLFVWFELLFLLGYRRRLHAEVAVAVRHAIDEWKKHRQPLLEQAAPGEEAAPSGKRVAAK